MNRILFPTDYSLASEKARDFAIFLAKATDSELVFLNSYEIPASQSTVITTTLLEAMKENSLQGMDLLKKFMAENHPEVKLSTHCVLGQVVHTVCELVVNLQVDLVIMGTRGASGIEEIFMGSNAQAIIKNATAPVLAIPHDVSPEDIRKMAYSTDFNFDKVSHAHGMIKELTAIFDAKLNVVHFTEGTEYTENEEEYIRKEFIDFDIKYDEIPLDEYDKDIQEYIDFTRVHMLCMIRRPHGFWERLFTTSHSEKRAMHSSIPLLVLREDQKEA